jgi:hypothetical protein
MTLGAWTVASACGCHQSQGSKATVIGFGRVQSEGVTEVLVTTLVTSYDAGLVPWSRLTRPSCRS